MSAVQVKLRNSLVLVATFVALGAVTGCHKKASGVNPNALGPAPAASRQRRLRGDRRLGIISE